MSPGAGALGRGISLGGVLDGDGPGAGGWLRDAHLDAIRAAGFHTVRLPVTWSAHQDVAPPYRDHIARARAGRSGA